MITCEDLIICQQITVDPFTNRISAHVVMEDIGINSLPLTLPFQSFCMLKREEGKHELDPKLSVQIKLDDEILITKSLNANFPEGILALRSIANIGEITIKNIGTINISVVDENKKSLIEKSFSLIMMSGNADSI